MPLNNCRLCARVHKTSRKNIELCPECSIMHEAQYKVTLERMDKLIGQQQSFRDIAHKIGYEPQRVAVYLANRFGRDAKFVLLDSNRKGYCYICNYRVYFTLESACLDCLQRIMAVLENRNLNQSSRMGSGRAVKLVLTPIEAVDSDARNAQHLEALLNDEDGSETPSASLECWR